MMPELQHVTCPTCGGAINIDELPPCETCGKPRQDWPEGRDRLRARFCSDGCGATRRQRRKRERDRKKPGASIAVGDPIVVNGVKYRLRQICAWGPLYLSKPPAHWPQFKISVPREQLRYDARAGVWRAPDGVNVDRIKPKGG